MHEMRVWANRDYKEDFYKVATPGEAFELINTMADIDLKNDHLGFNCFGLLVFSPSEGWVEWENSDGDTMDYLITMGEMKA